MGSRIQKNDMFGLFLLAIVFFTLYINFLT